MTNQNQQQAPVDKEGFFNSLQGYMVQADTSKGMLGLLVININQQRRVNALFGYQTGDAFVARFAAQLQKIIRKKDCVYRIGDGAFAMILPSIVNEDHALLLTTKVLRVAHPTFRVGENVLTISISIGIALCPQHGTEPETLLQRAELALDTAIAKDEPYKMYSQGSSSEVLGSWALASELDNAIKNDELELYFQPKINLASRLPYGAEALMRWKNPRRGEIEPDVFIALAEHTGRIQDMTRWALATALKHASKWPEKWGHLKVSLNVTPSIIREPKLFELVRSALRLSGAPKNRLILEVTEGALIADPHATFNTLRKLKSLGVAIAIDDFGAGYFSLSCFKNIPADELKIDKSFVKNMLSDVRDRYIIQTVIDLAHRFDLNAVAEGVESKDTLGALVDMNCDAAQGFCIGRPMSQKEFIFWLDRFQPASPL